MAQKLKLNRNDTSTLLKYLKVYLRSISSEYFLPLAKHIIQELMIRFPSSMVNIFFLYIYKFVFPSTVIEWNNLDLKIRNYNTFSTFRKNNFKLIRSSSSSIFNCHSPKSIKLIIRLRSDLSPLIEHKFRRNFYDTLNPICSCGNDIEHREYSSLTISLSKLANIFRIITTVFILTKYLFCKIIKQN